MKYSEVVAQLTPEVYQRLKQALELGKWPDGRRLTDSQKQSCMEAVLHYQAINLPPEHRSGYIEQPCKSASAQEQSGVQSLKIN